MIGMRGRKGGGREGGKKGGRERECAMLPITSLLSTKYLWNFWRGISIYSYAYIFITHISLFNLLNNFEKFYRWDSKIERDRIICCIHRKQQIKNFKLLYAWWYSRGVMITVGLGSQSSVYKERLELGVFRIILFRSFKRTMENKWRQTFVSLYVYRCEEFNVFGKEEINQHVGNAKYAWGHVEETKRKLRLQEWERGWNPG